jgi:hypothetical protein
MGLDMYLSKKIYVGNKYRNDNKLVKVIIPQDQTEVIFPIKKIDNKKISYIIEEIAYWRKANAIHKWFVKNIGEGVDDCKPLYVTEENLKELLNIINKILDNHGLAAELLPTQSGFFFGSTEYNDDYFEDLKYTKEVLEETLKDSNGVDYYYKASW